MRFFLKEHDTFLQDQLCQTISSNTYKGGLMVDKLFTRLTFKILLLFFNEKIQIF